MCEVMQPLEPCGAYRNLALSHYTRLLQLRKPFSFARYADGECSMIVHGGRPLKRCRLVDTAEEMKQFVADLQHTLKQPRGYYYGMKPYGWRMFHTQLERMNFKIDWVLSAIFHRANVQGNLGPLIEQLRTLRVCLVGPEYLKPLTFLTTAGHVVVSFPGAYKEREGVLATLRKIDTDCIVFSCGGLANLLIYDLHPEMCKRVTMIDLGAMWEPYVGKNIRPYHKHVTTAIIERNLSI